MCAATATTCIVALAACDPHRGGPPAGKASSEWTRSYALQPGGEFQIVGANGSIDVQGTSASTIEVKAERIVKAATDQMAQSMTSRVRIIEDTSPDKVVLRSEGLEGITLGVEVEVNFHVTAPPGTRLRLHTSNGNLSVAKMDGALVLSNTNGEVTGSALRGGLDVRATNGAVTIDLASVSKDPVEVKATNGTIDLTVPADAGANFDVTTTNGSVVTGELALQRTGEQSTRRMRARLNDGGTPITVTTTNGDVRLHAATAPTPTP
jgi:hypothetical protein